MHNAIRFLSFVFASIASIMIYLAEFYIVLCLIHIASFHIASHFASA